MWIIQTLKKPKLFSSLNCLKKMKLMNQMLNWEVVVVVQIERIMTLKTGDNVPMTLLQHT